ELSDKKSERIALGDLSAVGELIVRRGDEQQLVSFPGSLFDRLQPTRGRFAPLAIWPGHQPSEVVRVSAHYAAQARVLTLQKGSWRADDPAAVVDSERVRELVRGLIGLQAASYVSAQARPAHGFAKERPRLELGLADGSALTLELGAPTERGGYARVDGRAVIELGRELPEWVRELSGGPRAEAPAPPAAAEAPELDDEDVEEGHEHAH
ncbi:MAG: hypothetical protein JWN48_2912, partial [Myxococcaceae bacterium]|nr:hypothetical protein [Myxococcaceae bacterium]